MKISAVFAAQLLVIMQFVAVQTMSQATSTEYEYIAVLSRPTCDSITLRWAPTNYDVWRAGNTYGYNIERYEILANGQLSDQPQKVQLAQRVRPVELIEWELMVNETKYAAVAAQALYGDNFEMDIEKSDLFSIVNKVQENEMRYSVALFCADMSPRVAKASGLFYTDKSVSADKKYLYRVSIANLQDTIRGSVFTGCIDGYSLPQPLELSAQFDERRVTLRWSKSSKGKYTAYIVERSENGKTFSRIHEEPVTTISTDRYEVMYDSVPMVDKRYYYRVRGLTPFGEIGPASDIAFGNGVEVSSAIPHITGTEVSDGSIEVSWEFPLRDIRLIKYFFVERAPAMKESFTALSKVAANARSFVDKDPSTVNYYRIVAVTMDDKRLVSPVYFERLMDTIPPSRPKDVTALVDSLGHVKLLWPHVEDDDVFGYRIFRANNIHEEVSQVTVAPIPANEFNDSVNIVSLNESVFYSVSAVDKNQNHSKLSELLEVKLPDKIRPQPPVIKSAKAGSDGVRIKFTNSCSVDVMQYAIYRSVKRSTWERIRLVKQEKESDGYELLDTEAPENVLLSYSITALDDDSLESDFADPISVTRLAKSTNAVVWDKPVVSKSSKTVTLSWQWGSAPVASFNVYKSQGAETMFLFKSIPGGMREFTDNLNERESRYYIVAVLHNGTKSSMSKPLKIVL